MVANLLVDPSLFADPSLWTDDAGNCPPIYWDGTKYQFDSGSGGTQGGAAQYITCNRAAVAGETADVTMDNLHAVTYPQSNVIVSLQDTKGVNPDSPFYEGTGYDLTTVGTWPIGTGALLGGEIIQVYADSQSTSGYAYDFTLTPPFVAHDESLTTTEGTSISVTPVITEGGNPVTPDSLSVVDQPTHGTASVDGVSLIYAPMSGYFGTDAFTYDATVGGAVSNVATIDVVIHRLVLSPSVRQQTTHRINRDVDSLVACYVRGEAGRMDLSKADISVIVRPYGKRNTLVTLEASGDANGMIKFIVPADTFAAGGPGFDYGYGLRYQPRNLARFDVIASGALVYQALLEIA